MHRPIMQQGLRRVAYEYGIEPQAGFIANLSNGNLGQ